MKLLFLPIDIEISEIIKNLKVPKFIKSNIGKYNPYWDSTPIKKMHPEYDNIKLVLDQLPFDEITTITHKIQSKEVLPHVDVYPDMEFSQGELENIKSNEPSGYRILINGSKNKLEIFDGQKWVFPDLPTIPCCYLINATELKHRVLPDENRELIYVRGFLNKEKHKKLIETSLEKYKNHAVFLL